MLKSELEEVHERRPTLVTRYLTMRHRAYLDMIHGEAGPPEQA